jgi:hypothetical protein
MLHPDYPRESAAVKTGVNKCRSRSGYGEEETALSNSPVATGLWSVR